MAKVTKEFLQEFADLYHAITIFKEKTHEDLKVFILANQNNMNHPAVLGIFAEIVKLNSDFYRENFEICMVLYDLMQSMDWRKLNFGFGTYLRLGLFEDEFVEILEEQNKE